MWGDSAGALFRAGVIADSKAPGGNIKSAVTRAKPKRLMRASKINQWEGLEMGKQVRSRLREPSTWAGAGVVAHAVALLLASSGMDASAWAALFAGVAAAVVPEAK